MTTSAEEVLLDDLGWRRPRHADRDVTGGPLRRGAFEMCGRYTLASPREVFEGHFGVAFPRSPEAGRYKVAPSQDVPVVRNAA